MLELDITELLTYWVQMERLHNRTVNIMGANGEAT